MKFRSSLFLTLRSGPAGTVHFGALSRLFWQTMAPTDVLRHQVERKAYALGGSTEGQCSVPQVGREQDQPTGPSCDQGLRPPFPKHFRKQPDYKPALPVKLHVNWQVRIIDAGQPVRRVNVGLNLAAWGEYRSPEGQRPAVRPGQQPRVADVVEFRMPLSERAVRQRGERRKRGGALPGQIVALAPASGNPALPARR